MQRPLHEAPAEPVECPECHASALTHDPRRGELVCRACGLVLQERMVDPGPDWRAFDSEQRARRAHTGAPASLALHDKGLTTEMGWEGRDGQGRSIPGHRRAMLRRLARWQRRLRTSRSSERSLALALGEVDRMASRMGLRRGLREVAAALYRRAHEAGLARGRSIEGVAAACLYLACRQAGLPRTLDEVADASRVPRRDLARTARAVTRALRVALPPPAAGDLLPRFASRLRMAPADEALAAALLRAALDAGLGNGKGPAGMAAAALYAASVLQGAPRTQAQVAEVAGVTEVTVRSRYKALAAGLRVPAHPATPYAGMALEEALHRARPWPGQGAAATA